MTAKEHYNGIVIGAGQAGGPLSTALAGAGWKIALIRLGLSFEPPFEREYWICLVEGWVRWSLRERHALVRTQCTALPLGAF
ncbi:MAG: hypothetical protein ACETWR_20540 [Anaerolineae bacterium]